MYSIPERKLFIGRFCIENGDCNNEIDIHNTNNRTHAQIDTFRMRCSCCYVEEMAFNVCFWFQLYSAVENIIMVRHRYFE